VEPKLNGKLNGKLNRNLIGNLNGKLNRKLNRKLDEILMETTGGLAQPFPKVERNLDGNYRRFGSTFPKG